MAYNRATLVLMMEEPLWDPGDVSCKMLGTQALNGGGLSIKHKKPNSLQSQAMRLSTKEPCIVIRG